MDLPAREGHRSRATWPPRSTAELITGSAGPDVTKDVIVRYQPYWRSERLHLYRVCSSGFDRPLIIDELNRCDIDKIDWPALHGTERPGDNLPLPGRCHEQG